MIIIIPARLNSTRLPRKLLLNQTGHPLLWHTIMRAKESNLAKAILILTEDVEIYNTVLDFRISEVEAIMTGPAGSGTERIINYCNMYNLDDSYVIVNFQGDEPELPGIYADRLVGALHEPVQVATLASPIVSDDVDNPNIVKVVCRHDDCALYFSRCPIPYGGPWLKHIGIYAYTVKFLKQLTFSNVFLGERLEQLQWLQMGHLIKVVVNDISSVGIDTPKDYEEFVKRVSESDGRL